MKVPHCFQMTVIYFLHCVQMFYWQTHSQVLFWVHWYPCFGLLVMSPLGFKGRVGSALCALHCIGKYNIHSLRCTSGALHCQPLDSQYYVPVILDDVPTLPPTGAVPKSWPGVKLQKYVQQCCVLTLCHTSLLCFHAMICKCEYIVHQGSYTSLDYSNKLINIPIFPIFL